MNTFEIIYKRILEESNSMEDTIELNVNIGDEEDVPVSVEFSYYFGTNPYDDPHELNVTKIVRLDNGQDVTGMLDIDAISDEISNKIDFPSYSERFD
jgi:hypothetical protein